MLLKQFPLTHFLRGPIMLKFKALTLNGLSVWQVMIGKGCHAQFATFDLEKQCQIGHVQRNFGGSYSIRITTKQVCFVEFGISHLSHLHSNVACYSYCKPSDDQSPLSWHRSSTQQLDKRNNKTGCRSLRLINLLDPCGRVFYNHLWARCTPQPSRSYAAGYAVPKKSFGTNFSAEMFGASIAQSENFTSYIIL